MRDPWDRRIDQWFETGRQFVDGVAGNRPGKRKIGRKDKREDKSLQTISRWVEDKLDWFLEDDESWLEPWQVEQETNSNVSGNRKRPLDAISRRTAKGVNQVDPHNEPFSDEDGWPDDALFKVDRWQRSQTARPYKNDEDSLSSSREVDLSNKNRPLPRSSRRRS